MARHGYDPRFKSELQRAAATARKSLNIRADETTEYQAQARQVLGPDGRVCSVWDVYAVDRGHDAREAAEPKLLNSEPLTSYEEAYTYAMHCATSRVYIHHRGMRAWLVNDQTPMPPPMVRETIVGAPVLDPTEAVA